MKETILSKFKRLAVAMFAALCVGNVWGAYAVLRNSNARIEGGDFKFTTLITQIDSTSTRYGYLDAEVLNVNNEVVISSTRLINGEVFANSSNGYKASFDLVFEGVGTTTGCSTIEEFYDKGYCVKLTFNGTKKTTYIELDCPAWNDLIMCKDSGVISGEATFSTRAENGKVIPTGFLVSGTYDKAKGINRIEIHYILNKGTSNAIEDDLEATLNMTEGTFECSIPCENVDDKLSYSIRAVFDDGSSALYRDSSTGKTEGLGEMYEGYATYTWTGECNNKWDMPGNWSYTGQSYYGYPGMKDGGWYLAVAQFMDDAEVDLNGGTFGLKDEYRGFKMASGITVKLENGTILFEPSNSTDYPWAVVPANSTLILKDVAMPYRAEEPNAEYVLRLVSGSTLILEGNKDYMWRFRPQNANTKLKVQNGIIKTEYDNLGNNVQVGDRTEVEIENGVWVVDTQSTKRGLQGNAASLNGLAMKTVFRDGPDRRAQLIIRPTFNSGDHRKWKLVGTYDFKLSNKYEAKYSTTPYLVAGGLVTSQACTISVDVGELESRARIPLMEFKTVDSNVTTAMNTMVTDESKLIVTANGRNVKNRQRAKLEWDATAKTLYYSQDPIKGFRVIVR